MTRATASAQNRALAIAYRVKRKGRAEGGVIGDPMGEVYPPQGGDALRKTATHLVEGVGNFIGTPGRAWQEGLTPEDETNWAAGTAMSMLGASRLPGGGPTGAVGTAGSKLAQPEGIRAYHGSPHDFDKFDIGKIGTGEGAQAYGHGLYFAEREGVARSYRDALAADPRDKLTEMVQGWTGYRQPGEQVTADMVRNGLRNSTSPGLNKVASNDDIVRDVMTYINGHADDLKTISPGAMAAMKRIDAALPQPSGKMYEVNIGAKPDQFLDWDRPLSQQSSQVREAIPEIVKMDEAYRGRYPHSPMADPFGSNIYSQLQATGGLRIPGAKAQATEVLRERGVPGIRYLDQGSRPLSFNTQRVADIEAQVGKLKRWLSENPSDASAQARLATLEKSVSGYQQTSNYVVFDPGIIDILRKYGLAGAAPVAGAVAASQSDDGQMAKGGSVVNPALDIAYRVKREGRAMGGPSAASWQTRKEAGAMTHSGPILSAVAGRTDHHPMNVAAGSYVLPADHVSSLGQGNTQSGMAVLNHMFGASGPLGIGKNPVIKRGSGAPPAPHSMRRAAGGPAAGEGEPVPINAAGGEFVIPPEVVAEIGGGDVKRGHVILDNWVVTNRKKHIRTLKKLPGPAKS